MGQERPEAGTRRGDAICPIICFISCPATNLFLGSSSHTSPPQMCVSLLLLDDSRNWDRVGWGRPECRWDMEDLDHELISLRCSIQDVKLDGNGRNLKGSLLICLLTGCPEGCLGHISQVQRRKGSSAFLMGLSSSARTIRSVTRESRSP